MLKGHIIPSRRRGDHLLQNGEHLSPAAYLWHHRCVPAGHPAGDLGKHLREEHVHARLRFNQLPEGVEGGCERWEGVILCAIVVVNASLRLLCVGIWSCILAVLRRGGSVCSCNGALDMVFYQALVRGIPEVGAVQLIR